MDTFSDNNKLSLEEAKRLADRDGEFNVLFDCFFFDLRFPGHDGFLGLSKDVLEDPDAFEDWGFVRIHSFAGRGDATEITLEFKLQLKEEHLE